MPEYDHDPSQEFRQVKKGEWLRLDLRATIKDFLWPDDGKPSTVEYPLAITHQELMTLIDDIALGAFFVRPGDYLGQPKPLMLRHHTRQEGVLGLDYASTFTIDDKPVGVELVAGREEGTDELYLGLRSHYARGEYVVAEDEDTMTVGPVIEAWQTLGYTMSLDGEVQAYAHRQVCLRGRITFNDTKYINTGDDIGLSVLVARGKAIYATLGESWDQPNAA